MSLPPTTYIRDISDSGVMRRILRACLDEPVNLPPFTDDPRHILSHVCSSWRRLVLSTPEFWNQFAFHPQPFNDSARQLHIFHTFVQRSGSSPLTFHFVSNLEDPINPNFQHTGRRIEEFVYGGRTFSIVRSIIMPYIARIQHLKCVICLDDNSEFLLNIPLGSFRMLETVDITFLNDFATHHWPFTKKETHNFPVFRSLPELRQAKFQILNGVHPLDLHLPWGQMSSLDFGNTPMPSDVLIRIMRQSAPSLVDAYFYVELDIPSSRFLRACLPIEMPTLTKFRLRLINPSVYPDILLLFRLPALIEIRVDRADVHQYFQWDVPRYTAMLAYSADSLEKLILTNIPFASEAHDYPPKKSPRRRTSYQELDALFEATCNIHSLYLPWNICLHIPTVVKIANGELLPRLQVLEMGTKDADPIFNMIRTRRTLSSTSSQLSVPIKFLSLTLAANAPSEQTNVVKQVKALGLSWGYKLNFIPLSYFSFAN